MSPGQYALWLVEHCLPTLPENDELSPEEAEARLDQLAAESPDLPVLPRDTIDSRAFYYEDQR